MLSITSIQCISQKSELNHGKCWSDRTLFYVFEGVTKTFCTIVLKQEWLRYQDFLFLNISVQLYICLSVYLLCKLLWVCNYGFFVYLFILFIRYIWILFLRAFIVSQAVKSSYWSHRSAYFLIPKFSVDIREGTVKN